MSDIKREAFKQRMKDGLPCYYHHDLGKYRPPIPPACKKPWWEMTPDEAILEGRRQGMLKMKNIKRTYFYPS